MRRFLCLLGFHEWAVISLYWWQVNAFHRFLCEELITGFMVYEDVFKFLTFNSRNHQCNHCKKVKLSLGQGGVHPDFFRFPFRYGDPERYGSWTKTSYESLVEHIMKCHGIPMDDPTPEMKLFHRLNVMYPEHLSERK